MADNQIVIYESEEGKAAVNVTLYEEMIWLTQKQIADLFEKDRSAITKHINNIFKEQELEENSVCAEFAHTAQDGKTYQTKYYNLDMILSVGYRVNSKKGTQFRKWASSVLREHLIKGYSLNQQRLYQDKITELKQAIELMSVALESHGLLDEMSGQIINLVKNYTKTWNILVDYDENNLKRPTSLHEAANGILDYKQANQAIKDFALALGVKGLFGIERESYLKAILGNIEQTFEEVPLYPSVEERAAHLLYFIIKDHPFSDGNKRIGSFLFLLYLKRANIKTDDINQNTLVALALLIAESAPQQKQIMIDLILTLLSKG